MSIWLKIRSFIFFSTLNLYLFGQGIAFQEMDMSIALEKARSEDKLVFIDAYTTWCAPCVLMSKKVFTVEKVGDFYNEHFICLKKDMEKGEGIGLASTYNVSAYPTFLFINGDGELVHKGLGYMPVENFIQLGHSALNPDVDLKNIKDKLASIDSLPMQELHSIAINLLEMQDTEGEIFAKKYLEKSSQWNDRQSMELILYLANEYEDEYYNYIVEKRHLFIQEFGENNVDGKLRQMIENHLYTNIENVDLVATKDLYYSIFTTRKAQPFYQLFEINYHELQGNVAKMIESSINFYKANPNLDWSTLNDLAWRFYEKTNQKKAIKKAAKWAKQSVNLDENAYNTDTLAALYYKLGMQKKAEKFALKSIELAKETGQDASVTEDLLQKIRRL